MSTTEPKGLLLQKFLNFIGTYLPLQKVRIATLGGKGLEARLWKENQIPGENGWLIERQIDLGKSLIASTDYRFHNNLETLSDVMAAVYGASAGLDALHLDLCGTLESRAHIILPLLGLVSKGKGRCLALTVTEQRRNATLEHWEEVESWFEQNLDKKLYFLLQSQIHEQQLVAPRTTLSSESIRKSDCRELGVFRLLAEGLWHTSMIPDVVNRFGYISGSNSRMRTYVMHLNDNGDTTKESFYQELISIWNKQPISWIKGKTDKQESGEKQDMDIKNRIPNLLAFSNLMGPEVRAELNLLIDEATKGPDEATLKQWDTQKRSIEEIFHIAGRALNQTEQTKSTAAATESPVPKVTKRKSKKTPKKAKSLAQPNVVLPRSEVAEEMIADGFDNDVAEMIGLMEIEAKFPEQVANARVFTAGKIGLDSTTHEGYRSMAGRVSRTRGKYFEPYIKKVSKEFDDTKRVDFATIVSPVVSEFFKRNISANDLLNMM